MAKAQGKKKAAAKRGAAKAVVRPRTVVKAKPAAKKAPAKKKAAVKKAVAKKAPVKKKPAVKKGAVKRAPAKKQTGAKKVAAKAVRKSVQKAPRVAPKRVVKKAIARTAKNAARGSVVAVAASPAVVKAARPVAQRPAAAAADKKRPRRARLRIHSDGTPLAAWLTPGEKPRSSSFIPAPPRAEAPSLVAAPPASSDRLFRDDDISELTVRTVPVRVDIEQSAGRVFVGVNPEEVVVRTGEGIEWDFRYLGGADVTVDEVVIEFERPAPFSNASYRSRKPGIARPHRQLSGAVSKSAAGKRVAYSIRAMTSFKTELAITRPWVRVEKA